MALSLSYENTILLEMETLSAGMVFFSTFLLMKINKIKYGNNNFMIGYFRIFAQQCKNIEELCLEGCKRISDR